MPQSTRATTEREAVVVSLPEPLAAVVVAGSAAAVRAQTLSTFQPRLHQDSFVAPGAVLIGRVGLAAQASIWFGSVIRADGDLVAIGERSNLQDGTIVHSDPGRPVTVGRDVTVGHRALLHGCTVEDEVMVGMGSSLLNYVIIGTGSIVAAGAVVLEGTVIPPRSLVAGVPARVRRETTDADLARIRTTSAGYVALLPVYRHHLSTSERA